MGCGKICAPQVEIAVRRQTAKREHRQTKIFTIVARNGQIKIRVGMLTAWNTVGSYSMKMRKAKKW